MASEQSKQDLREDALAVVRRLRDAGHVAYFAGGCVRDQLLGLEPKDYDVATDARPTRVRELFSSTQAVGAAFGVILVRHRASVIEVATFRTDGKYLDGRRPEAVTFATAEEDARRRDFTINGMFYDPLDDRVIDYVGGRRDLTDRVLRAIGNPDERFEEDHLRVLRAFRFKTRFGLDFDGATADAIRKHAPQLVRISPERVGEELRQIFAEGFAVLTWWVMRVEFPAVPRVIFRFAGPQPADLGDGGAKVYVSHPAWPRWPFGAAMGAISLEWAMLQEPAADVRSLLDLKRVRGMVQALRQALKLSNDESAEMEQSLEGLRILLRDDQLGVATLKRFLARPAAWASREFLTALSTRVGRERAVEVERRLTELEQTDFAPPPLVSGDDLTAAGLKPGPVFKRVLDGVYDAQLEDRVKTKDDAMRLAMSLVW